MINLENHSKENIALYALLIGLFLSDVIPTIADAFVFAEQEKIKNQLVAGEITPKQYWIRDLTSYYLYNPIFWLLVILIIYSLKVDYDTKVKVLLGILGAGVVVWVVYKNIAKDNEALRLQQLRDLEQSQKTTTTT